MSRYLFQVLLVIIISYGSFFGQGLPDSIVWKYKNKFWNGEEVIYVRGLFCDNFDKELNNLYDFWQEQSGLTLKYEDQIDSTDLNKHLNFFGPANSYKNIALYLPQALKITDEGFNFGGRYYTDSLDAISIINSNGDRRFQLGNTFEGVKSLWTTFQDISQYFIMEDYAITRHGSLLEDKYYPEKDYELLSLREEKLSKFETTFYNFYYDPEIFTYGQNTDSIFLAEDDKINTVLQLLEFEYPKRKIECFLYKNLEQKYFLSATIGHGNPFPDAWQNHSVGFGAVEHESIHILSGRLPTLFAEGLVGYYYSTVDSMEWKKNRMIVLTDKDFSTKGFLEKSGQFDFSPLAYAASAYFSKYIIDTYGLDKFKMAGKFHDLNETYTKIYNKSVEEIASGWSAYIEKTKVEIGPERKVTFKIITQNLPDSDKVYITGNIEQFGNWNPGKINLYRESDSVWSRQFLFPEGTIFSYKITRGSWEKEALDEFGNVPQNSMLEVTGDETILIRVSVWKDMMKKNKENKSR